MSECLSATCFAQNRMMHVFLRSRRETSVVHEILEGLQNSKGLHTRYRIITLIIRDGIFYGMC